MFFLFKKMPQIPSKNKIVETARYLTKSIEGDNFVNRFYLFKKKGYKVQGTRYKVQGTRYKVQGTREGIQRSARENNLCSQTRDTTQKSLKVSKDLEGIPNL